MEPDLAKPVRRATDRFDPSRVTRSRNRTRYAAFATDPAIALRVLPLMPIELIRNNHFSFPLALMIRHIISGIVTTGLWSRELRHQRMRLKYSIRNERWLPLRCMPSITNRSSMASGANYSNSITISPHRRAGEIGFDDGCSQGGELSSRITKRLVGFDRSRDTTFG